MDFNALLNTIATLFVLLLVGFGASKLGIIDEIASKKLTRLIISIGQPLLIISSLLSIEYSRDNLLLGLKILALSFSVHAVMAVIAYLACLKFKDLDERKLSEFSIVFGNVGFIGFPILSSLFGAKGVFMGAFFMVPFNILTWTWGVAILARKRKDIRLNLKKIFINYGTVPGVIGVILYALNLPLPQFVFSSASYLGSLCTPITMLITGALLARRSFKQIFLTPKMYYLSFVKLIIVPAAVCLIAKLCGFGHEMILFLTALSAMPSAAAISMLSEVYDINPGYAAQTVGTSSLISIATMPAILWVAEKIALL